MMHNLTSQEPWR